MSRRAAWWRRLVWSLGAATGLLTSGLEADTAVAAAGDEYRSASFAPLPWREFSKLLETKFVEALSGQDVRARRLQAYLATLAETGRAPPVTMDLRAWIRPSGNVERVECSGLDDRLVAEDLQLLLAGTAISEPPRDMPLPVHLRLSLGADDPPRQGQ
jgi:hypothetical protein